MTPPPPASVASMMTPGTEAEDSSINRDLLSVMDRPTLRYWALLGLAVITVVYGISVFLYQTYVGMGL